MSITIVCGSCGVKIRAPETAAGKKARCPRCKASIRLPDALPNVQNAAPLDAVTADPPLAWEPVELPAVPEADWEEVEPPAEPRRSRRRSRRRSDRDRDDDDVGFVCPFCNSREFPVTQSKISTGGWILFVLLLLVFCWPLCWLGLLMKEDYRVCRSCGMKLG